MKKRSKQNGFTQVVWIVLILFIVTTFIILIRLVPPYLESFAVGKSLESLAEDAQINNMSKFKMQEVLAKRFYVNDVKSVDAKNLRVSREQGQLDLALEYEVRVHAIGNVDFVLKFDKKVTTE